MKKALAILLVLLVAGVAFGEADDIGTALGASTPVAAPSNTTMYIQANAPGRFVHGFASENITSYGQIISYTYDATPYKTVDLTDPNPQPIAYYLIATNTRAKFTVTLTANQLKSEQFVNESYYYIPYTLGVGGTDGVVVDADGKTLAIYTDKTVAGNLAASHELTFTLADSLVVGGQLAVPEGNYSAAITVAVTGI